MHLSGVYRVDDNCLLLQIQVPGVLHKIVNIQAVGLIVEVAGCLVLLGHCMVRALQITKPEKDKMT